jgi:beta-glucosidase
MELKAFAKTKLLQPGESREISLVLDAKTIASFWSGKSAWIADKGRYAVKIGASSKDIRLKTSFTVPEDIEVEKVHDVMFPNFYFEELSRYDK